MTNNELIKERDIEASLTVEEVAKILRLGKSTVHKAAQVGDFPCFRYKESVRFRPEHIKIILKMYDTAGWDIN